MRGNSTFVIRFCVDGKKLVNVVRAENKKEAIRKHNEEFYSTVISVAEHARNDSRFTAERGVL